MVKKTSGDKLPKQIGDKNSERNPETVSRIIIPKKSGDKNEELLKNLEAISDEDIMKMGEKIVALKKKREIPQELKDFREAWKEKIKNIEEEIKQKIIEVTENIPVKVEKEGDGGRLIEFELGGKKWKILDPKLETHSDEEYKYYKSEYYHRPDEYESIRDINEGVTLEGMCGSKLDGRKNRKLAKYVEQKEHEGLHMPSDDEMSKLLGELGEKIYSDNYLDQIAMLMYLTGMDGRYWLDVLDGADSNRRRLSSRSVGRSFDSCYGSQYYANICMISCE